MASRRFRKNHQSQTQRQILAAFCQKVLKPQAQRPNHVDTPSKLLSRMSGTPLARTVSGGQTKDHAMSNDIQTRASTAPVMGAAMPAAGSADVQLRPQAPAQAKPAEENKPDPQEARRILQEATEHLNKQMQRNSRALSFSVDDIARKVVITVKNLEGEVVRQIPSEVALRVAHNLDEIKGLLQDGKS
jgi:flagellar protein FlaG